MEIIFTGDIGFDKYMDGKWDDENLIAPEVLEFLRSADHVVANIEGPVSAADKKPLANSVAALLHTIDPAAVRVFKNMHADIWNINNNHIMDAGEDGVYDTISEAAECGAVTVGAGMNMDEASKWIYLEEAGGVGIFSVGYRRGCKSAGENKAGCLLWNEMEIIQKNINEIKSRCRWCIIISHGGEEFTSLPSPYTRDRYLKFLEMGADIIVCHHPHVPMNYETFPGKAIFYSLGNFIFDTDYQRAQYNTEKGLLLKLKLSEDGFTFEPFGLEIDRKNERVAAAPVPDIFQDVQQDEYEKLAPLAAKMFIAATKRQQLYLNPDKFKNASDEDWAAHFAEPMRSGRVPGEALDFFIICPLAEKEKEGAWKSSSLIKVRDYILRQM